MTPLATHSDKKSGTVLLAKQIVDYSKPQLLAVWKELNPTIWPFWPACLFAWYATSVSKWLSMGVRPRAVPGGPAWLGAGKGIGPGGGGDAGLGGKVKGTGAAGRDRILGAAGAACLSLPAQRSSSSSSSKSLTNSSNSRLRLGDCLINSPHVMLNFIPFSSLAMSKAPALCAVLVGKGGILISAPLCAGATPGGLLLGLAALPLLVPLVSAVLRLLTSSREKGTAGGCQA